MRRLVLLGVALVGGIVVGGGSAFGVGLIAPAGAPRPAPPFDPSDSSDPSDSADPGDFAFVPTGPILVPLVFGDGRLAGYASIEVQLRVGSDRIEEVTAKLPLLLHAINLRTYRAPLAAAPDGQIPDLVLFRKLVAAAAAQALGKDTVTTVAITQARPA